MKNTSEHIFETYAEEKLFQNGWKKGDLSSWNKETAIFAKDVITFVKDTQRKTWDALFALQGESIEAEIVKALCKEMDSNGSLTVLRHGFKYRGKTFRVAYFKPAHELNEDMQKKYQRNVLTVTRHVPYHPFDDRAADMLLSLNGLPLATIELNSSANGNVHNAIRRYREERNPFAPLFAFKKRSIVHFAVDTNDVYMTTRLDGDSTIFLPFNKGSHPGEIRCGAGNPEHSSGYKTGCFWEETLNPDNFIEIFSSFVFLETREEKDNKGDIKNISERMVFPRYHQLNLVKKLLTAARKEKAGNNYLIQHSAGSGKTNSIAWLSHRLASLHDDNNRLVFDCVVVVTDRTVLDRQLQDAVYQIEHAQGVVKPIDTDSAQLAEALIDGTKIVITTLQKFPFVLRGLLRLAGAEDVNNPDETAKQRAKEWQEKIAGRKYAVIIDEAHSSQDGESAREFKEVLGESGVQKAESWEDRLNQIVGNRVQQKNISFFAFTATPKARTISVFGRINADGYPEAFDIYSMRQAIEEGFILDVLKNYAPYNVHWELMKKTKNRTECGRSLGAKKLDKPVSSHLLSVEQKTETIIEHFRQMVKPLLNGRAKAMVVTSSRLQAVKYMLAFRKYIEEHNLDIHPLVAFSGRVIDPDTELEYSESQMNIDLLTGGCIGEKQLPGRFAGMDYHILIAANKYQTGFDQPLLHAMYVDKRLGGIQAVQTLSRLNRRYPGKENIFVVDFVNEPEDICAAFEPYFDKTLLENEASPYIFKTSKHKLDAKNICCESDSSKKPLSIIIDVLNERFGANFAETDRLFLEQVKQKASNDPQIIKMAVANTLEKFELGIKKLIEFIMIERMNQNEVLVTRYIDEQDFQKIIFPLLAGEIYTTINKDILSVYQ